MTRSDSILFRPCVLFAIVTMLPAGCMSLDRPYPDRTQFGIVVPASSAEGGGGSAGRASGSAADPAHRQGALRVARVRVAAPSSAAFFVYRTGENTFTSDYFNTFIATPDRLLTGELVQALVQRGPFATIVEPDGTAEAPLRLETSVTELYGDFRDSASPKATIVARFVLIEETPSTTRQLAEWTLGASEPIPSAAPADLAAGWGAAWGSIIDRLAGELDSVAAERWGAERGSYPRP